jgi:hypothetical protein
MYSAMDVLKFIDSAIGWLKTEVQMPVVFTIVLMFSCMTDFYGDVYYSEALKGREGILYPVYDRQSDIYAGLMQELDDASSMITSGTDDQFHL